MRAATHLIAVLILSASTSAAWAQDKGPWTLEIEEKSAACGSLPEKLEAREDGSLIIPFSGFVNTAAIVTCEINGVLVAAPQSNAVFNLDFVLRGRILKGKAGAESPAPIGNKDSLGVWVKLEGGGEPSRSPEFVKRHFMRFKTRQDNGPWVSPKLTLDAPLCGFEKDPIPVRIVVNALAQPLAVEALQVDALLLELKESPAAACPAQP